MCESVASEEKRLTVGPTRETLLWRVSKRLSLRGLMKTFKPDPAQRRALANVLLAVACGLASQGMAYPSAGVLTVAFLPGEKRDQDQHPQ